MDEVDIANDAAMRDLELRLLSRRVRRPSIGPENCEACEEPMVEQRRKLGLSLCIDCARDSERRAKLFSRD